MNRYQRTEECYIWDWDRMVITYSHGTDVYRLKWNEDRQTLSTRSIDPDIGYQHPEWTEVKGWEEAVNSYKSYIAESIIFGENDEHN